MTNTIHPNLKLLSHSSESLLDACGRKFQLYRMMPRSDMRREGDFHTDFGHLVGFGCQLILQEASMNRVFWEMFLAWKLDIEDSDGEAAGKTFWHALHAVEKFATFVATELVDYRIVMYDGSPATELGYKIDCEDGFYSRGKLDALLRHRITKQYAVFECKTTGARRLHEAMYKNSGQGVGYSVVVDAISIAANESTDQPYSVLYCVYQTFRHEWTLFEFTKTFTERALWIKDLLLHIKRISDYAEAGYFPKNGNSCYAFFRPCEYFEVCGMSDRVLIGDESKIEPLEEKEEQYKFHFTLDELIDAQLQKQGKM